MTQHIMNPHFRNRGLSAALASVLALAPVVAGGDEPIQDKPTSRDQIIRLIDEAMPPVINNQDNSGLVKLMNNPRLGTPLSEGFDSQAVILELFGRRGARLDPSCRRDVTDSGDIDRDVCRATKGEPGGGGAYQELRFSKHMELGNLSFLNRPADEPIDLAKLPSPTMSDEEAYNQAMKFLADTFALPPEEVPEPPENARNPFPVKDIALAHMGVKGEMMAKPVEKLVVLKRGLFVDIGDVEGVNLDWLPGPGNAFVVMDDNGIKHAAIRDWKELQPNPEVLPENFKTRSELLEEIADDMRGFARSPIASIKVGLVIDAMPAGDGAGLLLPAVQAHAAPVPDDPSEEEQELIARTQAATAGIVRTYSLVHFRNEQRLGD